MRPTLVVLIVSLLLAVSLSTAPAASAHTDLVSSSPAAGATVAAAPTQVSLSFSEAVAGEFADLVVVVGGAPPQRLQVVEGAAAGPTVVAAVPPAVSRAAPRDQPVDWRVDYRVTSADGHPIQGSVGFEVTPAPPTSGPPDASPSVPQPSAPPPGSTDPGPASAGPSTGVPAPAQGQASTGFGGGAALALGVTSLLVLAGLVAFVSAGMRRRGSEDAS